LFYILVQQQDPASAAEPEATERQPLILSKERPLRKKAKLEVGFSR
jgi:hypothetical protein